MRYLKYSRLNKVFSITAAFFLMSLPQLPSPSTHLVRALQPCLLSTLRNRKTNYTTTRNCSNEAFEKKSHTLTEPKRTALCFQPFWHCQTHLLPRQGQETQGIALRSESSWQLFSCGCNLTVSHTKNHHSDIWTLKSLFPEAHETLPWCSAKESVCSRVTQVQTDTSGEVKQVKLGFTLMRALTAAKWDKHRTYRCSKLKQEKSPFTVYLFLSQTQLSKITRSKPTPPAEGFLFFIVQTGSPSFRFNISINLPLSRIYNHKQFMTTSVLIGWGGVLLQCESTTLHHKTPVTRAAKQFYLNLFWYRMTLARTRLSTWQHNTSATLKPQLGIML